jgi:Anti-sigma-K factor rskA/Putative zinc-finger
VEHVDELIPAHALRALDPDDERAVAAHLATCERCRLQLRDFEGVAAALAYASPAVAPPPELRDRVLGAIEPVVAPQPAAVSPTPARGRERWSWWPRVSLVAVPALGLAVLALALWNISLQGRLSDRDVVAATAVGKIGSVVAFKGGDVTLYATLPTATPGHVYEAWVVRGGTPLPAGTFAGGDGIAFDLTRGAKPGDTIAITLEPGTGGPKPRGQAVASGELA